MNGVIWNIHNPIAFDNIIRCEGFLFLLVIRLWAHMVTQASVPVAKLGLGNGLKRPNTT